jgi:4-aminobutyrate aminotransferase/(S)-3-amino-2-methylpropionate transaminase
MRARMEAWQDRYQQIGDVRGLVAMLEIELVKDPATKEPDADLATAVVEEAARSGLLLLKSGIYSNCIRVLSPLTLSDAELDEALAVWEQALEAALTA